MVADFREIFGYHIKVEVFMYNWGVFMYPKIVLSSSPLKNKNKNKISQKHITLRDRPGLGSRSHLERWIIYLRACP